MYEDAGIEPRLLKRQILLTGTTNAAAYVDHVVPQGRAQTIIWAGGSHNDAVARACSWNLLDGLATLNTPLELGVTRATGILHSMYEACHMKESLVLRAGHTLRFYVNSATAGTVITIYLWVEEIRGEDNYGA